MSRKDLSITVRNLTGKQYTWLEKEKEKTGLSISAIVRILIQKEADGKISFEGLRV